MTVRVKPRAGIILAGIPRSGAEIPDKLAKEWLDNKLVVPADDDGTDLPLVAVDGAKPPRRGRGRPKGSKTRKPITTPPFSTDGES